MVKLNLLSKGQALLMISLIKVNYSDKNWVVLADFCRIYVYDDNPESRREFSNMVKQVMGVDVEWQGFQLSISWKGGVK